MMKEFRKFTTMAQIIEARVKQKTGTEAEWLSATIPVLPGEQAFVTDRYNFKLNTSKTPKMFKDLEYFYKGDIIGSVSPEENLDSKIDGVYRAKVAGEYAGVMVKEGYYTLLRKKNGVWGIESEVKVDIEDTTKIDLKDGEFLVGTASGVNVGRKITGSDIIKNQGGNFANRENIPVYNGSTKEWTQGVGFSREVSNYTLAQRTVSGQIKAKDGFREDDVATYGQMPIKRFKNAKLAEEYATGAGKRGELVIIEEEDAVYRIDKWDNLVLLIDEEGGTDSFISLSDTPDNFPIDRGGYFVRYDEGGKLVFDRFRHADVGIEPERSARQVVATDENSDFKSISYSVNPSGNTIPLRKSGGALAVGDPISDEDAVPYYMFDGLAKTDGSNIDKEKFKDALDIQDVETKDTNISVTKDYTEWGINDGDNLQKFNDKVYDEIVNREEYTLPVATKETLGGVIVGENLNINSLGELNALNTTYEKGTLEQLIEGKEVVGKVWDAKTLQEWSGDRNAIPYNGANKSINFNTQNLTHDGKHIKRADQWSQKSLSNDFTQGGHYVLRENIASLSLPQNTNEGDVVITLPITSSTFWVAEIDISLGSSGYESLRISAYAGWNGTPKVTILGGNSGIYSVVLGRLSGNTIVIIKRASTPTAFSYGKVNLRKLYTSIVHSGVLDVKSNYKIEFLKEEDIEGLVINATVLNKDFERDPYLLDFRNFTNVPNFAQASNVFTKTEATNTFIPRVGDADIDGTKRFLQAPIVPEATLDDHAINKGQADLAYINREGENEVGEEFALKKGNTTLSFDEEYIRFNNDYADVRIGSYDGWAILCYFKNGDALEISTNRIGGNRNDYPWEIIAKGYSYTELPITSENGGNEYKTLAVSVDGVHADENGNISLIEDLLSRDNDDELLVGLLDRLKEINNSKLDIRVDSFNLVDEHYNEDNAGSELEIFGNFDFLNKYKFDYNSPSSACYLVNEDNINVQCTLIGNWGDHITILFYSATNRQYLENKTLRFRMYFEGKEYISEQTFTIPNSFYGE